VAEKHTRHWERDFHMYLEAQRPELLEGIRSK
jgi:hypothetical protein